MNEMKKYEKELETIDKTYKEIVKKEENNLENRKTRLLNVVFLSFITSLSSTLLYFLDATKELKFIFLGVFLVLFTSVYYFYKKRLTKNYLQNIDQLVFENENNKLIIQKELEDKKTEYLKEFENRKTELGELISNYRNKYVNLRRALMIFEEKSITITQSKFMPFKSLKNFSYGNIIRINKKMYENFLECNDTEIEIKDDFPDYLNIPNVNLEDNKAFLVKVIHKSKNKIILSRKDAYSI